MTGQFHTLLVLRDWLFKVGKEIQSRAQVWLMPQQLLLSVHLLYVCETLFLPVLRLRNYIYKLMVIIQYIHCILLCRSLTI